MSDGGGYAQFQHEWWHHDKSEAHDALFEEAADLERRMSYLFDRFYRLDCLNDPYHEAMSGYSGFYQDSRGGSGRNYGRDGTVSENVIASAVDTVVAIVAATRVRARLIPDGGDWSDHRRAKRLELYAEGLAKVHDVHAKCVSAFKSAALKGTGIVKVWADWVSKEMRVEHVPPDDIIVDEAACRNKQPRQIYHRMVVEREELILAFPEHEEAITQAGLGHGRSSGAIRHWAGYRPIRDNQLVVIHAHRLPFGLRTDGTKGTNYEPGRELIAVDGVTLYDGEWDKPHFPYASMVWTEREGWYGIGGAERIAGHQHRLNRLNFTIDRQHDQLAVPTTYVPYADADLAVQTTNRLGTIAAYKVAPPTTVIPKAVSPETYARHNEIKESAFEEFGVSRMAASAKKPGGLDSGVALREYRDQTTQRFSFQEDGFEQLCLCVQWLQLEVARELGTQGGADHSPVILHNSWDGKQALKWAEVDMQHVKVMLQAASTLPRTPAGRQQLLLEWAQAGVITTDEFRQLSNMPDLQSALSLYTSTIEHLDRVFEETIEGKRHMPEPFDDLAMAVWRFERGYLKLRGLGAPEDVCERIREFAVQAAWMLSKKNQPDPMMAAAGPMDPAMAAGDPAMAGVDPAMAALPPAPAAPNAALAPQAMDLIAGRG